MTQLKIFVVEDNPVYAKAVCHHLTLNPDNEVLSFSTGKDLLANLHQQPEAVFLDYSLPDMSGIEVLRELKRRLPKLPVVIVSGQEDVATAVSLLREGAYDYIVKDENARNQMWKAVTNICENKALRNELDMLRDEVNRRYDFSSIKGQSPAIKQVFKLIEKAAQTSITVSISGETGTGKELFAKAIHYNSRFKDKPMVTVNVAAIPSELIESELFGHEKGAFTGALQRRVGKFEQAHGSTLFLDEIGELDLSLQAKLLRVLQEREVVRLGGSQSIKAEARILVATHRNLAEEVKKGNFREDLYYRLLGLPIELPPLRDRGHDVLLLSKFFLNQFCQDNQIDRLSLSTEAQERLHSYTWPGNVRELKAVVELAAVMAEGSEIKGKDISLGNNGQEVESLMRENLTLREYTQRIIEYQLKKNENNVLKVAKKLAVGKSTIYRMLKSNELNLN